MAKGRPYHEVLGVRRDAPPDEVKRVYRELVKRLHPDQFQDEESARRAENQLKEVNAAWSEYLAAARGPENGRPEGRPRSRRWGSSRSRTSSKSRSESSGESAKPHHRTTRERYRSERQRAVREREERERR